MKKEKFLAWFWVALCAVAIFLVVPLARAIQNFVAERWGRSLFGYFVLTATAIAFVSLLYVLIFRLKIRSPSQYIWLSLVAGLYIYFTLKLWRSPEEAVHFLEYGLLGYFLFRALSYSIKDKSIYLVGFLLGALVGIIDEVLQWMVPNRYWDFRDVGLNALAAGLIQVAIWKGIRPPLIGQKIGLRSIRRVSLLIAVCIVLLGLCASNTPQRVAFYAGRMPILSFLLEEEPMYEFSLRHKDSAIGVFYSRLTLDELRKTDGEMADHYGQILKEWKEKDYGQFLRHHTPLLHPFLYEMRVHLFRRDRAEEQRLFFIAFKENLILEKYFVQTLLKSSYAWDEDKAKDVAAKVDREKPYKSPVSRGVFIHLREKVLWAVLGGILLTLAGLNIALGHRERCASKKPS